MPFDEDLVKSVLKNSDIVKVVSNYLSVTKKGKNFVAICPFHDDTNPSMSISPERQMFKCFVCNEGGSAIAFVQKYEHVKFPEAVKKVAAERWMQINALRLVAFPYMYEKVVDERKHFGLPCHEYPMYNFFSKKIILSETQHLDIPDPNAPNMMEGVVIL